jgi:hypothetical protein
MFIELLVEERLQSFFLLGAGLQNHEQMIHGHVSRDATHVARPAEDARGMPR